MTTINASETAAKLTGFIKNSCEKESYGDVLIGVSGGIDSATSLTLSVRALGATHVYPVLLPYGKLHPAGLTDAWHVINKLAIPHRQVTVIDILPFVNSVTQYDATMDDGRKGNIMARMRMVLLYDLSKKLHRLVVGTENKTEHLLGYYTRFGDEASDIEPLRELYKTQVYNLARYLDIPNEIITKPPTAGLWEGQTDEGEFGFSYKIADEVLYLHFEKHLSKEAILANGYSETAIETLWRWIEKGRFKDRVPYTGPRPLYKK